MLRPVKNILLVDLNEGQMFMPNKRGDYRIFRVSHWENGRVFFYDTASRFRLYYASFRTAKRLVVSLVKNVSFDAWG